GPRKCSVLIGTRRATLCTCVSEVFMHAKPTVQPFLRAFQLLSLLLVLAAALIASDAALADTHAYALVNGKVYASSGWASAVAISRGRILAVGDAAVVRKALPRDAEVLDLKGEVVFPGLHDMHVHPLSAGRGLRQCK